MSIKMNLTRMAMLAFMILFLVGCSPASSPTSQPIVQTNLPPIATEVTSLKPTEINSSQQSEQATTIKIGALHPVTGDAASGGKSMRNALTFAIDLINKEGGIKSLNGAQIELVYGDTQTKPDVGVSEVERLAQKEGVLAIVGAYNSSVTKPATQAAERLGLPFLIDMAASDEITERGYKWIFRLCPKASWYARDQVLFVQYLNKDMGLKVENVALLHEDTDWGMSVADGQKKYLEEAGYKVAIDVTYPANAADLSTQVAKVKSVNPDVVLTSTYLNDAVLIAKEREKLGMSKVPFIDSAGGTIVSGFIESLGNTAEGLFSVLEFSPLASGYPSQVNEEFHKVYGEDFTGNSVYSYVAGWVLADALERAGSTDKEAIRNALASTSMPHSTKMILPQDVLTFDQTGQNPNASMYIVQVQGGKLIPVYPAKYAAAKVILP
jgi:branched-chain amino acid transport system substrate-binding protein